MRILLVMVDKEKLNLLWFFVVFVIVFLVVYCVLLSVFLVYLMWDYSLLKEDVKDLCGWIVLLEVDRVVVRVILIVLFLGDWKWCENEGLNF